MHSYGYNGYNGYNLNNLNNLNPLKNIPEEIQFHILSFLSPLQWMEIVEYEKQNSPVFSHFIQTTLFPSNSPDFYRKYFQHHVYKNWEHNIFYLIHHDVHLLFHSFTHFLSYILRLSEHDPLHFELPYSSNSKNLSLYVPKKLEYIVKEELIGWMEVTTNCFFKSMKSIKKTLF
jgi:hypothetical protein